MQQKIGDYITIVSDNTGGDVAYPATFNFNPNSGQHEEDVYYVRVSHLAYRRPRPRLRKLRLQRRRLVRHPQLLLQRPYGQPQRRGLCRPREVVRLRRLVQRHLAQASCYR